jgi:hypothetical protein
MNFGVPVGVISRQRREVSIRFNAPRRDISEKSWAELRAPVGVYVPLR